MAKIRTIKLLKTVAGGSQKIVGFLRLKGSRIVAEGVVAERVLKSTKATSLREILARVSGRYLRAAIVKPTKIDELLKHLQ